jgi:hypothetical protein
MQTETFKQIIRAIVAKPLEDLGYSCDVFPQWEDVWFGKKVLFDNETTYLLIGFQPSGSRQACSRFAVNLWRDYVNFEIEGGALIEETDYFLYARLASCLWIKDRYDSEWESDHWWNCFDEETLTLNCKEAVHLLERYGIPWLENPATKNPV